ncbi:hypothetical protein VIBR0546_12477 [Vibrio brasiliensis LMG 20546]|uniref:Uncharacterized protein n=1 Tax=Vibrio brasiliensis LMG 20546 TaxID=945543 RepID=E8LNZ0_9VIBR|nr:hypothetical protein VIBR0546_12477 [Vibrio brasiliensis LMG 20546]
MRINPCVPPFLYMICLQFIQLRIDEFELSRIAMDKKGERLNFCSPMNALIAPQNQKLSI